MKPRTLTNWQFMKPVHLGGGRAFTSPHDPSGNKVTVELMDEFPWVRVSDGAVSKLTTVFNLVQCDDFTAEVKAEKKNAAE